MGGLYTKSSSGCRPPKLTQSASLGRCATQRRRRLNFCRAPTSRTSKSCSRRSHMAATAWPPELALGVSLPRSLSGGGSPEVLDPVEDRTFSTVSPCSHPSRLPRSCPCVPLHSLPCLRKQVAMLRMGSLSRNVSATHGDRWWILWHRVPFVRMARPDPAVTACPSAPSPPSPSPSPFMLPSVCPDHAASFWVCATTHTPGISTHHGAKGI